jgi:hypothetical protein
LSKIAENCDHNIDPRSPTFEHLNAYQNETKTHSGFFGDFGLLGVDDVHDEAAFAHLGEARLDDKGALHPLHVDDALNNKVPI